VEAEVAVVGVEGVGRTLAGAGRLGPTGSPPVPGFLPQDPNKSDRRGECRAEELWSHTAQQSSSCSGSRASGPCRTGGNETLVPQQNRF
jgi:hypothetical protein